jgi:hypothetical protein
MLDEELCEMKGRRGEEKGKMGKEGKEPTSGWKQTTFDFMYQKQDMTGPFAESIRLCAVIQ